MYHKEYECDCSWKTGDHLALGKVAMVLEIGDRSWVKSDRFSENGDRSWGKSAMVLENGDRFWGKIAMVL